MSEKFPKTIEAAIPERKEEEEVVAETAAERLARVLATTLSPEEMLEKAREERVKEVKTALAQIAEISFWKKEDERRLEEIRAGIEETGNSRLALMERAKKEIGRIDESIENPEFALVSEGLKKRREELTKLLREARKEFEERFTNELAEMEELERRIADYEKEISTLREDKDVASYLEARETVKKVIKELKTARKQIEKTGFEDPEKEAQRLLSVRGVLVRDERVLTGLTVPERVLTPVLESRIGKVLEINERMRGEVEAKIVETKIGEFEVVLAMDCLGAFPEVLAKTEQLRQEYPEQEKTLSDFKKEVRETVEKDLKTALEQGKLPSDLLGMEKIRRAVKEHFGEEISRSRRGKEGLYPKLSEFCQKIVNEIISEIDSVLKEEKPAWEIEEFLQFLLRSEVLLRKNGRLVPNPLLLEFAPKGANRIIWELLKEGKAALEKGVLKVLVREGKDTAVTFWGVEKNKEGQEGYRLQAIFPVFPSIELPRELGGAKPKELFYLSISLPSWLRTGLENEGKVVNIREKEKKKREKKKKKRI